jgi:type I restriction enzyme M protein
MRRDHGVDGDAQRLGQLCWMLFLRALGRSDELPKALSWDALVLHSQQDENPLEFVNEELIPRLASIKRSSAASAVIGSVFSGVTNYMEDPAAFRQVVALVDSLNVTDRQDRHAIGEAYETLLAKLQSAGNAGEFYTPRPLTDVIAEVVDPRPGDLILDPACGTGGFLVAAAHRLRARYPDRDIQPQLLRGVEKKALPYLLAQTNMWFHDLSDSGVVRGNLLARPFGQSPASDQVDIVLSNPPYGALEDASSALNAPDGIRSRETTDLFMALIMGRLRPGGQAAVIVPDGFLFGTGAKEMLRSRLVHEFNLHTILRLPTGVFSPYTGIRTNVLFFDRTPPQGFVWFYELGLPAGKAYTKTRPIRHSHLDDFVKWWGERSERGNAWAVQLTALAETGFRLDLRRPSHRTTDTKTVRTAIKAHGQGAAAYDRAIGALADHLRSRLVSDAPVESELLVDNLGLALAAPSRLQARTAIIQCGLRGFLSPSDKEDSSVLEDLVGRGLVVTPIKRSDSGAIARSLTHYPQKVPAGWAVLPLSCLGTIVGGGTPKTSLNNVFTSEGGHSWLTPADLRGHRGKYVSRGSRNLTDEGLRSCGATLLPRGTVLFSSRAPIGYAALAEQDIATNQGFKSIIPFLPEMSDFLYYLLRGAAKEIDDNAPGTTFREVSGRALAATLALVPPLVVQAEICKALDEIEELFESFLDTATALDVSADTARSVLLSGFDV